MAKVFHNFGAKFIICLFFVYAGVTSNLLLSVFASNEDLDPGKTSPETVEIAIGESVNISCRMNLNVFPDRNSSDLYFIDALSQQRVPPRDISIVNESTIIFMLRNAVEQQKYYRCLIDTDAIMDTKVYVGTPPKAVEDLSCRIYDLEYMFCNFTKPNNPIPTQYNLTYRTTSVKYIYDPKCNYDGEPLVVCNTSLPHRSIGVERYNFTLEATNSLSANTQNFVFNMWNNVIPAQPGSDFRVIYTGTDTLQVAWTLIKYEFNKMKWEIRLKPDGFPWQNLSGMQPMKLSNKEVLLNLQNLPYAYWWYDLRVRVKVRSSAEDGTMWSDPFVYRFRTAASRPIAPRTDVGSFYVDSTETRVRLYWEQLPSYAENGANFSYVISEIQQNGKVVPLKPIQMELNSAVFQWQKNAHYKFAIKSRNHMGESLDASRIEIVPLVNRNPKSHTPRSIHNVYHATNRTYTLTWDPPLDRENLQNFTVYWCHSKRALQNECKGSIHFKLLNKTTRKFTTEPQSPQQEHSLNLAVSANYLNYNTGMHWTACTVDVNSDLVKMEPEMQTISDQAIHVQWSPESVCSSILEGYNLTYCEVDNNNDTESINCLGEPISVHIDKNSKKYLINNLKPYTSYKISIYMFSRMKAGKASDPLIMRTMEGAPSPPRQLQVTNIVNTSATISWLPPNQPNGRIRHYIINFNNKQLHINVTNITDPDERMVYELRNLTCFTAYKVYVVAHTLADSKPSNDIHFTTLIGYPSMDAIQIRETNNDTLIQWSKPSMPAGRVEFYEIAVTVKHNDEIRRRRITTIFGSTSCSLKVPACNDHEDKTVVEVRAVNAALRINEVSPGEEYLSDDEPDAEYYQGNDELVCVGGKAPVQAYQDATMYKLFKSPWRDGQTYFCSPSRLSRITTVALMVISLSLCVMSALYLGHKKYNKMASIDYTLPPGLDNHTMKGGFDNETLDKSDMGHHSKEILIRTEKHHLLASVGNDSGFLGEESRTLANISVVANTDTKTSTRSNSESSADSLVESTCSVEQDIDDPIEELDIESIETNTPNKNEEIIPIQVLPPTHNEAVNRMSWQMPSMEVPTSSQCGGYVSVGSIGLAPLSNGYVQPTQALQKQPLHLPGAGASNAPASFNNGYTTLDELGKQQIDPQPQQAPPGMGNNPLISGYVTQRDLTAFGHQRIS